MADDLGVVLFICIEGVIFLSLNGYLCGILPPTLVVKEEYDGLP
jgi:hypothetical protein